MKRKIIWVFFFLSGFLLFSESPLMMHMRVDKWAYLGKEVSGYNLIYNNGLFDLFQCDKNELRIIRNAFYAKHGYIFNSSDLKNYFSQFDWYNGIKENVDSDLSDNEKSYIAIIQKIEANYPKSLNKDLIGYWSTEDSIQTYFDIQEDNNWVFYLIENFENFRIFPNGTFYQSGVYGLWSFENNKFKITSLLDDNSSLDEHSKFKEINIELKNLEKIINQNIKFSKYVSKGNKSFLECNLTLDKRKWFKLSEYPMDFYK